jgi:hypothetical protein
VCCLISGQSCCGWVSVWQGIHCMLSWSTFWTSRRSWQWSREFGTHPKLLFLRYETWIFVRTVYFFFLDIYLPVIFLCIDKSLKWTAYLHFQNFPMPFDIFFFFLCIVKSLEWAVIVWFLDVIAITFLQVSQCSLRDLLLHCCTDDAPDVRQSAFALLGDLALVSLMCICIRHTEALTSIDGISLMLMILKHGM